MKLGLMLGYWTAAAPPDLISSAQLAESCGYDSVWTAEAYGSDVVSPLCWIGANTSTIKLGTGLMQISARTPASAAMTAATIDHLSGGRLILGLGVSGPQVVEGWYGQPFPKPLARTREYVDIIRTILRREKPVEFPGDHYPMPYPGGTGLGKPLKITVHPLRSEIPIYLGAEGPRNVKMATEIADGWLPIFYSPYRNDMYKGITFPKGFEVACPVTMMVTHDVEGGLRLIKMSLSFYIGGMGAKDRNFHLDVVSRMGFEDDARKVQDLFMDGKRDEAVKAVPDALADEISLVGPRERIRDRLAAWEESPVTTLLVGARDPDTIKLLPELL
ncbi:MAG TPA: LLM class F420-dependent oxidoreductase [Actinomycetota bacterium]|jgi:F420-dependent oxidoreductase-like protein|nr:LLM class F420-dependent oxidoreductase [Actinomycetota bacterium]